MICSYLLHGFDVILILELHRRSHVMLSLQGGHKCEYLIQVHFTGVNMNN